MASAVGFSSLITDSSARPLPNPGKAYAPARPGLLKRAREAVRKST